MRWFAMMVIRKAEPECSNAEIAKDAAELNLAVPLAIPLRKHDYGGVCMCVEESAPNGVVLRIRSLDRAGEFQNFAIELVLAGGFVRIECGAVLQSFRDVLAEV